MSYGTPYIDEPQLLKPGRVGRSKPKMANSNNNTKGAEVTKTPRAKYAKTRGEHYKDIVIAMLVTAIIAFIGGMHFSNQQHSAVNNAVKAALAPSANAQAAKK